MSSEETPEPPVQRGRREAVREKAQQVQAQQSKALVIRRVSIVAVIVALVAAAAVVIVWSVTSAASRPLVSPANMTDDGITVDTVDSAGSGAAGGTLATPTPTPTPTESPTAASDGRATAKSVDIRVYVDYLSPGASAFQIANATQLADWVHSGAATLTYHPIALLTAKSNGTKYSLRAASASVCVASYSPGSFYAFNQALLQRQPDADADGFSDTELADIAIAAGADDPKRVRSCIQGEEFTSWVQNATERAVTGPLPGTRDVTLTAAPTILVNGVPYAGALDDAMEFAHFVSDAYYKSESTPSPTPTATTSPSPTPSK